MAGIEEQLDHLAALQAAGGGWPYQAGKSAWTEPTVFALLALQGIAPDHPAAARGFDFLSRCRGRDGGWLPAPGVGHSAWLTAPAVLLLSRSGRLDAGDPALGWLLSQSGRESRIIHRLRRWMLGAKSEYDDAAPGWPWIPDTASWVIPTAFSLLALQEARAKLPAAAASSRIDEGRRFLIARRCADLGWNHGDSRFRGFHSVSFPDTTGLALLALRDAGVPDLAGSVERARAHARTCRSTQGLCWLYLGLRAHGAAPDRLPEFPLGCRRTMDAALALICHAAQSGKGAFSGR